MEGPFHRQRSIDNSVRTGHRGEPIPTKPGPDGPFCPKNCSCGENLETESRGEFINLGFKLYR